MCVCVYVCRTPPRPPPDVGNLTEEEKVFLASRRQSVDQANAKAKAAKDAAAAAARAKWAAAGGSFQAYPDIDDQELREDVEKVACSCSVVESCSRDLSKILGGLNQIQRATIPFEALHQLSVDLESVSASLDQRVFNAFSKLNLVTPAAADLFQQVDDARKKRRAEAADESVVAPGSGSSTPRSSRPGSCTCRKVPACQIRCPCVKAGQKCTPLCWCGDDCYGGLLVLE